jgi:5-methylcytosine-specific restriction endonuclease McrA
MVPGSPPKERIPTRMPSQGIRRKVLARDGRHCRFCGIPVIDPTVRRAIRLAYPVELRWGDKNSEQHAAFQCMWLQFDHLLPHSRGGDNSLENVLIACAPCNNGRGHWTLEEVGLHDPRATPVMNSAWDGLERFLVTS